MDGKYAGFAGAKTGHCRVALGRGLVLLVVCSFGLWYDHEQPGKARVMEGLETEILAKLGFPDSY